LVIGEQERNDFLSELDAVTQQLSSTREKLWATQDQLKESEDKLLRTESRVAELESLREKDAQAIRDLQEENSKNLEEEAKVRESLELLKKVYTRTQLKSKEDQETAMLLEEEKNMLVEENTQLREACGLSKHEKASLLRTKKEGLDKERQLTNILSRVRRELAATKESLSKSEAERKSMAEHFNAMNDPMEAQRQIDLLNEKIVALERELARKEDKSLLMRRAVLDEDLDDSMARQFLQKLDCTSESLCSA